MTETKSQKATRESGRKSVWVVRLLGLFLLSAQGAGLVFGGAYYFKLKGVAQVKKDTADSKLEAGSTPSPQKDDYGIDETLEVKNPVEQLAVSIGVDERAYKIFSRVLGGLLGISAIGFFFRFRGARLLALLLQGLILYVCLSLYFSNELIPLVYPIMLYGIFMVLFLNSGAVQKAFLPRLKKSDEG